MFIAIEVREVLVVLGIEIAVATPHIPLFGDLKTQLDFNTEYLLRGGVTNNRGDVCEADEELRIDSCLSS